MLCPATESESPGQRRAGKEGLATGTGAEGGQALPQVGVNSTFHSRGGAGPGAQPVGGAVPRHSSTHHHGDSLPLENNRVYFRSYILD